jgi:FkbM family methyltransferase
MFQINLLRKVKKGIKILISPQNFYIYSKKTVEHHNLSFSQEGEDRILARIFEHKQKGFYVDIGAHHPQRLSNTYSFYLRGWRGINVDAMPGSIDKFNAIRPEDINLEIPISSESETLTYYSYNEPALNTFSKERYESRFKASQFKGRYWVVKKLELDTMPLSEVLHRHLPPGQTIDFMTVDVEGLEHQVLLSNDWSKYRPEVVLVEELASYLNSLAMPSRLKMFMEEQGYELFARTVNTSFYRVVSV